VLELPVRQTRHIWKPAFMKELSTPVDFTINDDSSAKTARLTPKDSAKNAIAVALGHSRNTADGLRDPEAPPKVLATGRGEFAQIILDIAFKHGVKVREDTDLAEILAAIDLDSEIPVEAFIAVAEILRYVYANSNQSPPSFQAPGSQAPGSDA
jgi:flagellar biosynthesis protein